jgi:hypothetical protein
MITQDKLLSFGGRITDINTPSFVCAISTAKESLFKSLSTMIAEPHPDYGIRPCVKIIYPSVFRKVERHQYHELLCEMINTAGENGILFSDAIQEARVLFTSRGICKEFINLA